MLITEIFAIAQKRYQPYINLTDKIFSIEELSSEEILIEIKKTEIKSLYFRAEKIELNSQFASDMHKLIKVGIKEIFLFCNEYSQLTTVQLNDFLAQYKIYINFQVAQLTLDNISNIRSDKIGQSNLLGFDSSKFIENKYQLIYQNGAKINLLNDATSDEIILANHAQCRASISKEHKFDLAEPKYIAASTATVIKPRIKEISKVKKINTNLEVTKNIDLNLSLDKETEEENELDLDKSQEDNKFNLDEAVIRANILDKLFFKETYIANNIPEDLNSYDLINQIFNSDSKIKFISSKALDLIIKNHLMFASGINADNLPIGLAIKKDILFVSAQRVGSMQINELTINPNPIAAEVSNPLKYS